MQNKILKLLTLSLLFAKADDSILEVPLTRQKTMDI